MATNIAANLIAALTREWQALGLHDIGSGLPGIYSSEIAATCLSRDMYLAARVVAQDPAFLPNGELNAEDASTVRDNVKTRLLHSILHTGQNSYGPMIWPEQDSESLPSDPPSNTSRLTWSSEAGSEIILDGMLEILLLNVQFVKHQAAQEALPTVSVETTAPSAASHEEFASHIKTLVVEASGVNVTLPFSKGTSGEPHPPYIARSCAQEFLEATPDNVFCFCPDQPDHHIEGRWSFSQLVAEWQSASSDRRKTRGIFPDARKTSSTIPYEECTVRCTCAKCEAGEAYQLKCVPFPFGNETILIHKFRREGETWAVILTDYGGHIPFYRLWGAFQGDLTVTGDSEYVVLQEISDDIPDDRSYDASNEGRHSAQQYSQSPTQEDPEEHEDDGDDNEFSAMSQKKRKRNSSKSQRAQTETKRRKPRKGPSTNSRNLGFHPSTTMNAHASHPGFANTSDNEHRPDPHHPNALQSQPDDDDDEEIPLAKLRIPRVSTARQDGPREQPFEKSMAPGTTFAAIYSSTCKHVMTQKCTDGGKLLIVGNTQLQEYLKNLEIVVKEENEWLVRQQLCLIDDELVKSGAQKLPGV